MVKIRNAFLALCGVFTMLVIGLGAAPSPAGAAPAPLNNVFVEISTTTTFNTATLAPVTASVSGNTLTVAAGNPATNSRCRSRRLGSRRWRRAPRSIPPRPG